MPREPSREALTARPGNAGGPGEGPPGEPTAPALSVIIVSWNTRDLLRRCLRGVARAAGPLPHEVWVVDNASSDGSGDMVAEEFPTVHLIRNGENLGFARASNLGIERARATHLLLLNPDAEPLPGSLPGLLEYVEAHPRVAVAGPLLLDSSGAPGLNYGYFPSLLTALMPLLRPLAHLVPGRPELHALGVIPPLPDTGAPPRDVDYVSGAAMTVRRRALREVGGLDDRFFLYFEETDLCRRLRSRGWRVVWLPSVRMIHQEGGSREKRSAPALSDYFRSLDRYLRKHHRPGYVALVRGAMLLALGVRYVAARAVARRRLADYYLASVRALRAESHV